MTGREQVFEWGEFSRLARMLVVVGLWHPEGSVAEERQSQSLGCKPCVRDSARARRRTSDFRCNLCFPFGNSTWIVVVSRILAADPLLPDHFPATPRGLWPCCLKHGLFSLVTQDGKVRFWANHFLYIKLL